MRPAGSPDRDDEYGPWTERSRSRLRRKDDETIDQEALSADPVVGERQWFDAVQAQAGEGAAPEPAGAHQDDVASTREPVERFGRASRSVLDRLREQLLQFARSVGHVRSSPEQPHQHVRPPSMDRIAPVM